MGIALSEWVRLIDEEYLQDFIAAGGAAVKLAVAPDSRQAGVVLDTVADAAVHRGYLVARVDAAETRVQMIDQIFYAVARQVDWEAATDRWLRDRLLENGYVVSPEDSLTDADALAQANDTTKQQILGDVRRWTTAGLVRDFSLCKEFRTAASMLCWGHINPQNVSPADADVVHQWLRGEKCSLTALKRMQIFQRIGRHNARLMLASLSAWLPRVGYNGLVLLLDISAVVSDPVPGESRVRYTRNAVLDCYEVLREFIDGTDTLSHLLLVAAAGPGLTDHPRRSLDNYDALKLRTSDEIRDRSRANPLGARVRLDIDI